MPTLSEFVDRSIRVADLRGLSDKNPVIQTIKSAGEDYIIAISHVEVTHAVLPFNVLWIVSDPSSEDYRKVLRRTDKAESPPYRNTWEEIADYEGMFTQVQYYDHYDTILLGELPLNNGVVPPAEENSLGIVRLGLAAADPMDAIACGDNDPRLSDPRVPVSHEHALIPAAEIENDNGAIRLADSPEAVSSSVLVVTDDEEPSEAHWRRLTWDDVNVTDAAITSIEIVGPTSIDEMSFADYSLYANYTVGGRRVKEAETWATESNATISSIGSFYVDDVTGDTTYVITATYTGTDGRTHTDTHNVLVRDLDVVNNPLSSISILGPTTVDENTSTVYNAVATYQDGSTAPASGAEWAVNDVSSASVGLSGILETNEVDLNTDVNLTATFTDGGITRSYTITVTIVDTTAPTLTSLTITGPTSVDEGTNATYTCTATYSNGSTQTVTPAWSTSNANVATISVLGELSGLEVVGDQPVDVLATFTQSGHTASTSKSITVVDHSVYLQSVEVAGPTSVNELTNTAYTATAFFSDGSQADITGIATWSTSNSAVGTMTGNELVTVDVLGNKVLNVIASYTTGGTTQSGQRAVSVIDLTIYLSSIAVSGASEVDENTTSPYTCTATMSDGSTSDVTSLTTWTVSNTSDSSIGTGGVLTANEVPENRSTSVGAEYSVGGVTRSASKDVSIIDTTVYPQSIEISGATTLRENTTTSLTATLTRTDGATSDVSTTATWISSNNTTAIVNSSGLVQANEVAADTSVTITVSYTEYGVTVTDTHVIQIEDFDVDEVTNIAIIGDAEVNEGATVQYVLQATFQSGTTEDISSSVTTWTVVDPSYASIDSSGSLTGSEVSADQAVTITANYNWTDERYTQSGQDISKTLPVTIKDVTVTSLTVDGPTSVYELATGTYTATAEFSDGTSQTVIPSWSVDLGVASIDSGGIMSVSEITSNESAVVTATFVHGGVTSTDTHNVNLVNIVPSLTISGPTSVNENTSNHDYSLNVAFNDGNTYAHDAITWSASDPALTLVVDSGDMGVVASAGEVSENTHVGITVDFVWKGVTYSKTHTVIVVDVVVDTLTIVGASTVEELTTSQYSVNAAFSDGTNQDVTAQTTLGTSDSGIATVDSSALLIATEVTGNQSVNIIGAYVFGGVTYNATKAVTVQDVVVTQIAIDGASSVNETETAQYTCTETLSNGDTATVTPTWSISSGTAASIDATGLLTSIEVGGGDASVTVAASYERKGVTVSASKVVTIKDNSLTSIEISGPTTVTENTTTAYTAVATYVDGTTRDVTADASWSTTNSTVGTMSSSGTLTSLEITSDTQISIIAMLTEQTITKTDSVQVMVTDVVVPTSVIVNGPASIHEGNSTDYEAVIEYSDGSQGTPQSSVTWGTSDSLVATVDTSGTLSAQQVTGNQAVNVTASYTEDGVVVNGYKSITVMDIVVSSIAISGDTSMSENTSKTFTATATYSDSSTQVVTPIWSVSPTIGSINTSGVYSPGEVGTDTQVTLSVSYTENGITVTDDHIVDVTDVPLSPTGLEVTGSTSVDELTTSQYTATVTWDDSSTSDVTGSSTWTLDGSTTGSISSSGLLTAADVDGNHDGSVNASFTDSATGVTVTDQLSITVVDLDVAGPALPIWGYSSSATMANEAAVLAACTSTMPSDASGHTFVTTFNAQYVWFAHKQSLGTATFLEGSFAYPMTGGTGTVSGGALSMTIGGELWWVYRSDSQSFGSATVTVNYA
jgi:hypothetical protein